MKSCRLNPRREKFLLSWSRIRKPEAKMSILTVKTGQTKKKLKHSQGKATHPGKPGVQEQKFRPESKGPESSKWHCSLQEIRLLREQVEGQRVPKFGSEATNGDVIREGSSCCPGNSCDGIRCTERL